MSGVALDPPGRPGIDLRRRVEAWVPALVLVLVAIAAWQLLVSVSGMKQFILPGPIAILGAVAAYFPELWSAASYTVIEVVIGLVIGAGLGMIGGALTARWGAFRESVLPFAIAANSVPIIAFGPLFNNWFGVESQLSRGMIAAVIVFFPVMINTVRGLTSVQPAALELMRSVAASDGQIFWKVRVPTAAPFVFTALRVGTTLATIGAIVGEYFGAPKVSLGQYIVTYSSYLNFERSWAAIVFACAIGIVLYGLVVLLERIVAPWTADRRTYA
jgi:NitT/TauT family transport system permease protein